MKFITAITLTLTLCIFTINLFAQTIYVDASNSTGIEDGTKQHPFNTVEEGITGSKTGDTIFINSGNYSPFGGELFLKPGTILFGESPTNTIINADIRDTTRSELPFEVHNLTFGEFYCSRGTNITASFYKPCIIKNNICQYISIGHGGGYIENGDESVFKPIPFFHIENNKVSGEITFNHGSGKIVGRNVVKNNQAETISLKHGAVTAPLTQPEPGYGYLIESNTVTGEIAFRQGASLDSTMTEIIKDLNRIILRDNQVNLIEIMSGAGHTYHIDKNTIQKGIDDASGACWTTISNNTILNGGISDRSGGTNENFDCEDPDCMVEDQFIENNTIYFEATGDPEEDFAIIAKSRSVTIRNNKITCKGAASGIQLKSGGPTNVINNVITVEPVADYGIETKAGYGVVTGNQITGGKIGYYSKSGAVIFENNTITGSHWGFYSMGAEKVKNNTITNCTGHGMVLDGLRGPVTGNTVTNNDSTGIWVIREVDLGGGILNGEGKNIIRGNGYYDMRISINAVTPDTLFINNNVWDHETIADILKYDILNESTGGKLLLDFKSIIAKPATVQLSAPANLAVLNSRPAQLVWQAVESAETYRLQVSTNEYFGTLLFDTLLAAVTFSTEDLPNQTDFYWRVLAANLAGEGEWSPSRKFNTLITGVNETSDERNGLVVYPNPTNGKFRVLSSEFRVEIVEIVEVVDLNGKVMERFTLLPSFSAMSFDIGHLPSGVYVVKILTRNSSYSRLVLLN
jgi:hypothetical protein